MISTMYLYGTYQQTINLTKLQQDRLEQERIQQRRFAEIMKKEVKVQAKKVVKGERSPKQEKYEPNKEKHYNTKESLGKMSSFEYRC